MERKRDHHRKARLIPLNDATGKKETSETPTSQNNSEIHEERADNQ